MKTEGLMYFNGFGGFSEDGKEYRIKVNKNEKTPVPWSHVLANEKIGTLVTSNGGGFSWYGNSRENKLTSWRNDVILDTPSEEIILEDDTNQWSAFSNAILENEEYEITYGFGYAKYKLLSKRYEQEVTIFVTKEPYQKVSILKLKNLEDKAKTITIKYEIDAVLGVSKEYTDKHLVTKFENGYRKIFNRYSNDYANYNLYMKIISPEEIEVKPSNHNASFKPKSMNDRKNDYMGLECNIRMEEKEEKEIIFLLDYREEKVDSVPKFENLGYYKQALEEVKYEWKNRLEKVQVTTPVDSMNILLNGWIIYQTLTSRVWGRVSFYQSGGAFGFRDQLQDMLSILYFEPQMVRKQILYHAEHQFKEGDVLHWWHPEKNNGIRTRFSDDLLWLLYVTCEYIQYTGDFAILLEKIRFAEGRYLNEKEDEIYIETKASEEKATLVEHCIRAINRSLDFGEHGLPKMGSGDWNDGMNAVGGESIWLGFFLADILKKFLTILKDNRIEDEINQIFKNGNEWQELKEKYEVKYFELQKNLDKAWDGRWFKRAYFKNGEALGSNQNDECKIDNISQSWAVISGVAKKEKQVMAMESVENYLVDHENMLIKLLTPAFCNTKMEPGYIKSYLPGVRENGGQYTHGAIWAIIANCMLNKNERATEYFRLLNPIEHARTKEDALKYKAEPYVIVADIYSHPNLIGRGGWSWYTGSASWYFIAGVKYILGLNKMGEYMEINPKLPREWKDSYITFTIENTSYVINMQKEASDSEKDKRELVVYLDNELVENNKIKINLDGKKHIVDVKIK